MATDTHAIENAQAWLENIVEMVKRLEHAQECSGNDCDLVDWVECPMCLGDGLTEDGREDCERCEGSGHIADSEPDWGDCAGSDDYHDSDAALEAITESPLSVEVRSGWTTSGTTNFKMTEYQILLTTGGPALRIIGELDQYGEPETARLEYQDWGTPWTEYVPLTDKAPPTLHSETYRDVAALDALLAYARSFYYGS